MYNPVNHSNIHLTAATVTFLEMRKRPAESLALRPDTDFELLPRPINVEEYRGYYYGVGQEWSWLDRMVMPDEELSAKINAGNIDIYLMRLNGNTAGFAEFQKEQAYTEIVYFGLLPAFIGKGLGKYFLQWSIQQAWSYNPSKIQVNTCTLDHPNAISVYKKAGFIPVDTETQQRKIMKED